MRDAISLGYTRRDAMQPLTQLSPDEQLFRSTVRDFARTEIAPLVRTMDEEAHFDAGLLRKLHELGFMGIQIPEEFGGAAGTLFEAVLAVEEISAVDPAVGVLVDVQNTLVINALLLWATEAQKKKYLPALASKATGSYALSEAASGSDAFALQCRATRDETTGDYVLNGAKLWITNALESSIFLVFATIDPAAGYKGITCFIVEKGMSGFTIGRKEDKLGIRAELYLRAALRQLPRACGERARRAGQGLQDCHRDTERRPHRHRRADAGVGRRRVASRGALREGAQAVRQGAR